MFFVSKIFRNAVGFLKNFFMHLFSQFVIFGFDGVERFFFIFIPINLLL